MNRLTWDDKGAASSYIGKAGMSLTINLKRTYQSSTYTRPYAMSLKILSVTAPKIQDYKFTIWEIITDKNQELTTPAITEGTLSPATLNVTLSTEINSYFTVTLYKNATDSKSYVTYKYSATTATETLIGKKNLKIDIALVDALNKSNTTYSLKVVFNKASPPKFKTTLDSSVNLVVGTAKNWVLPEPDPSPYTMATKDPVKAIIPASLKLYLTFNSATRTFFWSDDLTAQNLVTGKNADTKYSVTITLTNSRGDVANFTQSLNITNVEAKNKPPYFADLDFTKEVYEVFVGSEIKIELPQPVDPDQGDTVTVSAKFIGS